MLLGPCGTRRPVAPLPFAGTNTPEVMQVLGTTGPSGESLDLNWVTFHQFCGEGAPSFGAGVNPLPRSRTVTKVRTRDVSVLRVTVGFVQRAFKFRLYPTSKQHDALGLMCAAHAELYNAGLQERRDAWAMRKTSIGVSSQMLQLKEIRTLRPDQAVWSFTSQQQTLRRLDKAFAAFFRRVKAGDTPGYPRFRTADSLVRCHPRGSSARAPADDGRGYRH